MLAKFLLVVVALFVVACSDDQQAQCAAGGLRVSGVLDTGNLAGNTADDALVVPAGIAMTPRPGINSTFSMVALTLLPGADGVDLYAAVRNDGKTLACNPSFSVELRDQDEQTVGTGINGLMSRRFYRFKDGSGTIASCVAPGDVTMVAMQGLSLDVPIEAVHSALYQSNYWGNLDLDAIDGVGLSNVKAVADSAGVAYTGALTNGLEVDLSDPTVAVFPLNAAGRPLGVAYGGSSVVLPPCGTWDFQTNALSDVGVSYDAYPMGGP
ncbi:MAG TPA: hypothetical protein VJV79_02515 [Polyangiaceae bacterium]|nr:hypothetical protein [Polyangiaceae bacterium]